MFGKKKSFSKKMRQIFVAGVLVLLPLIITFYLLSFLYRLLTVDILPILTTISDKYNIVVEEHVLQFSALVIVIVLIFVIGLIARVYLGRKIFQLIDKIMMNIPIAKTIYSATKQVIDSFKATSGATFSKVVMVEYARRDMWMVGFVIKDSEKIMTEITTRTESYNVFIPTTPNPTSGFIAVVAKSDVREINISVEDAIKFIISLGLVNLRPSEAEKLIKESLNKDVH